jgi:hypothetical protein
VRYNSRQTELYRGKKSNYSEKLQVRPIVSFSQAIAETRRQWSGIFSVPEESTTKLLCPVKIPSKVKDKIQTFRTTKSTVF